MAKGKLKNALKKVGKTVAEANVFLTLVPFKGLMIKQLSKAGIKLTKKDKKKVSKVAELFHKHIVKKHTLDSNVYSMDEQLDENIVGAVASIVVEIVKFIKGAIDKKKQGQPTSPEEKSVADSAEKIEAELKKKGIKPENIINEEGDAKLDNGKILKMKDRDKNKNLLIIGGIAVVAAVVLTRK